MSSNGRGSASAAEDVRKAFANLPFDERLATLVRIELDLVGDAFQCIVSSVSKAVDEIGRACNDQKAPGPSDSTQQAAG
jgi:hypothetical protein